MNLKKRNLSTEGNANDMRKRCKDANPSIATKKKYGKVIKGYVGLQIGLLELLWRRGYIDPLSPKLLIDTEARTIARNIPYFKDEPSEIEFTMKEYGVDIMFTPKAHYELAGRGIEYLWGVSKIRFRSENSKLTNDERVNNLKERVHKLLSSIPINIIQKYSRRVREYKLSYLYLLSDSNNNVDLKLKDIEKMKKDWKGKRCVLNQDTSVVKDMAQIIDNESIVIKNELAYVIDLSKNSDNDDQIVRKENESIPMGLV